MQTLTYEQVKSAALKAYAVKSLSAQNVKHPGAGSTDYGYYVSGSMCAVGAAMTCETLGKLLSHKLNGQNISTLCRDNGKEIVSIEQDDDLRQIERLQNYHDSWLLAVSIGENHQVIKGRESAFISLLKH